MFSECPALLNSFVISEEFPVRKLASGDPLCNTGMWPRPHQSGRVMQNFNLKDELGKINFFFCKKDLQDQERNVPNSGYPVVRVMRAPRQSSWHSVLIFVDSVCRSCGFGVKWWQQQWIFTRASTVLVPGCVAPTSGLWSSWRFCGLHNINKVPFSARADSVCN